MEKYLVGYLPYSLKIYHTGKENPFRGTEKIQVLNISNFELLMFSTQRKPIMKPLSDINPNKILNKHYFGKEKAGIEKELQMIRDGKYIAKQCSYNICEVLISEHFDIHGLIEKGLAIDINTLNK